MENYQSRSKEYRWAYDKEYSRKNRVKRLERAKAWNSEHREQNSEAQKRRNARLRSEMLKVYGQKCNCCGETTADFLGIDHIARNGQQHRKSLGGSGANFLIALKRLNWPTEGIQILCMNCISATRYGHLCPHKRNSEKIISTV